MLVTNLVAGDFCVLLVRGRRVSGYVQKVVRKDDEVGVWISNEDNPRGIFFYDSQIEDVNPPAEWGSSFVKYRRSRRKF